MDVVASLLLLTVGAQEDCGDTRSTDLDHAMLAMEYESRGQYDCALKHRITDRNIHGDVDSLFNLAVAFEKT
jgi:hypothetical protein